MNADDVAKLLDNGWRIVLFRNQMGSYTAVAVAKDQRLRDAQEKERQITDDFTVTNVLHRLTEKVTTGRIVESEKKPDDAD